MKKIDSFDEFQEIISDLDDLEASLQRRFNRKLFRHVRRLTGSQSEWAERAGVSTPTIGHWERGYSTPTPYSLRLLAAAARKIKEEISSEISSRQLVLRPLGPQIDPLATSERLNRSILRAALTDFDFDQIDRRIVPVPFTGDSDDTLEAEIAEDRRNLLESLKEVADLIASSVGHDSNVGEVKLVKQLQA